MAGIPERTAQTTTFNQMVARVAPKYLKGVHDQVFNDAAAWRAFSGRVSTVGGGAADFKWNVDLGTGTGEPSYKDLDTINTHRHDTETVAYVDTKEYFEQWAISFRERDKHRGELAVVQGAAASMMKAKKRLVDALDTHLILDGTGNSSKRILGMAAWCAAGVYITDNADKLGRISIRQAYEQGFIDGYKKKEEDNGTN